MSAADPALDHAILRVLRKALVAGETESFALDDNGAALLEHGLLRYGKDESLPVAVEGIIALCVGLSRDGQSPTAARRTLEVLVACRDRLPILAAGRGARAARASGEALRAFQADEQKKTAPMYGGAAPEGSVALRDLLPPPGSGPFRR